jgi:hypothetical protein
MTRSRPGRSARRVGRRAAAMRARARVKAILTWVEVSSAEATWTVPVPRRDRDSKVTPPSMPSLPVTPSPWSRFPRAVRTATRTRNASSDPSARNAPIGSLLLDRGYAEKILRDYARYFNDHRPHQGRHQLAPSDNPNARPSTPTPNRTPPRRRRPHQRVPQSPLTTRLSLGQSR